MGKTSRKESRRSLVLLVAVMVLFVGHSIYLNCVAEDAYISFRYARHLDAGLGLRWNVDEAPVEGYTNFLWVLIAAGALKLGVDLLLFSQAVGILAGMMTIILSYICARRIFKLEPLLSLLPGLFLAVAGPFATWASSGMETNLFTALVLAGTYFGIRFGETHDLKTGAIAYSITFLATLTRPEGLLIFVILLSGLVLSFRSGRRSPAALIPPVMCYLIPLGVYVIWRLGYFGYLLPNTYYAKTGGTIYQYLRGIKYTGAFLLFYILPCALFLIIFALLRRRDRSVTAEMPSARPGGISAAGPEIMGAITGLYTLYIIYVGGDYMAMFRFFVPILPFIYLLLTAAAAAFFRKPAPARSKKILAAAFLAAAAAFTLFPSTPLEMRIFPEPSFMHGNYRGVQTERWHAARLTLLGKFFRRYQKKSGESLATRAIGAVSYYSNMKVYGLDGLVDPEIAHQKSRNLGRGLPGHEKTNFAHVLRKKPTYFIFDRRFYPRPKRPPSFGGEADELIRQHYKLSSFWLADKANQEEGYFSFLELKKNARD